MSDAPKDNTKALLTVLLILLAVGLLSAMIILNLGNVSRPVLAPNPVTASGIAGARTVTYGP